MPTEPTSGCNVFKVPNTPSPHHWKWKERFLLLKPDFADNMCVTAALSPNASNLGWMSGLRGLLCISLLWNNRRLAEYPQVGRIPACIWKGLNRSPHSKFSTQIPAVWFEFKGTERRYFLHLLIIVFEPKFLTTVFPNIISNSSCIQIWMLVPGVNCIQSYYIR